MTEFPKTADSTMEIYSHRHRRYVIECLDTYDDPLTMADLADEVAIRDHGTPLQNIPEDATNEIHIALYHWHIPKLIDAQLVDYDRQRDLVRQSDHVDDAKAHRAKIAVDGDGHLVESPDSTE